MRLLLVSPDTPATFWSLKHAMPLMSRKALLPPLGLLTVAAMLPEDWEKRLVDLAASELADRDIQWADMVFTGGMSIQSASARDVVDRCKALQTPVVVGGPLVSAAPEAFDDADHLVVGEAEVALPAFLQDLAAGRPRRVYKADAWADLKDTPAPLWSLVDVDNYAMLPLQYSRGCPFKCDFCDVTVLFGRQMRTKPTEQILRELDELYALGWRREVFFVDDNFIGNKRHLKRDVLPAVIEWMEQHGHPFSFYTQASVNLADDEELMRLMVQAGFGCVFVGIETIGEDGFLECNKVQNRNRDLVDSVHRLQRAGFQVQGGFILGFDSDPASIFDEMIEFIQRSGIVTAMVGLLDALPGTALYDRLARDGRLLGDASGDNTDGCLNFVPKMDAGELVAGFRRVVDTLFRPDRYHERIRQFLKVYEPAHVVPQRIQWRDVRTLFAAMARLGVRAPGRRHFWRLLFWGLRHPRELYMVMMLALIGYHFRRVFAGLPEGVSCRPSGAKPASAADRDVQARLRETVR